MKLLEMIASLNEGKHVKACGALFYAEDTEKYLFVRRSKYEDSHIGDWETPGGKIDTGESWEQGLKRELREELNYIKPIKGPLNKREWVRHTEGDTEYRGYLIRVDKEFKPRLNKEHDLHRWVKWGKWPQPLRDKLKKDLRTTRWTDKLKELTEGEVLSILRGLPLNEGIIG